MSLFGLNLLVINIIRPRTNVGDILVVFESFLLFYNVTLSIEFSSYFGVYVVQSWANEGCLSVFESLLTGSERGTLPSEFRSGCCSSGFVIS